MFTYSTQHTKLLYTAFTVSQPEVERIRCYIRHQQDHHRKMSFEEELARLFKARHIRVTDDAE